MVSVMMAVLSPDTSFEYEDSMHASYIGIENGCKKLLCSLAVSARKIFLSYIDHQLYFL
jgi:hypothetical protein